MTGARPPSGIEAHVPAVRWLREYDRTWLSGDIVAGVAAGAVVIPQAMAYATIAHLPTQVGLYTCMVPMVVYVLLGGSRAMSVSTTSTVALLTGSTLLAAGIAADAQDPARELATLTLLVGAILIGVRLLRVGSIVDNISEATLTGVKIGVGLTVAAGQLPKLLGIPGDPAAKNFFSDLRAVWNQRELVSGTTVAFSAGTLVLLLALKKIAPKVPGPLVAVAGGIALVAFTSIEQHGLAVIAKVPSGLPTPVVPKLDHINDLIGGAFAIAIMVFLETVAVARNVRRPSEPPIDNDQELTASGASCIVGALFRGMPSAGGFSQTAINQDAGARTQLSELVTALLAVGCALFLGAVLSDLPQATLGALVMVAVIGLIKPAEMIRFWQLGRAEFWVAAITAGAGLWLGMLPAVLIGVVLTLFLVLYELDHVGSLELNPTANGDDLVVAGPDTTPVPGLMVLRVEGQLYTANVRSAHRKMLEAVDARGDVRVLVLDLSTQTVAPVGVMDEYENLLHELTDRNVELWATALPPRALAAAKRTARWQRLVDEERAFPTALAAVRAFRDRG